MTAPRLWLAAISVALTCVPGALVSQQASLQGMVTSASDGSPLEGVAVAIEAAGRQIGGAFTDHNGFYQVGGIAPGAYSLRARLIGYLDHAQSLSLMAGERMRLSFSLEPSPVVLQGITVSPERGAAVRDLGRQRVTSRDLRVVPIPAGTGDLATYIQTLPGVTTTGDRGGQLFVRGGTPAENLVLLDGIPIYHPFHILGFFSVFPEDLVSSADFYAGGFGARYSGRTSSVLDVRLRDGNPKEPRAVASLGPFMAEALVEGPAGGSIAWLASVRRSLVEETSGTLLGTTQPLAFNSQLLKLTVSEGDALRCSGLALNTSDRGRLDPAEPRSRIAWENLLLGSRCVAQFGRVLRLAEVTFSYSKATNHAVSRGSSNFRSGIERLQHDAHFTTLLGSLPLHAGYHVFGELTDHDLRELFGTQRNRTWVLNIDGYVEAPLQLGKHTEIRPGVVLTLAPRLGFDPRVRASWEPWGRSSEQLQAALGLYRQHIVGITDVRDVGSVFVAWMGTPDGVPVEALHGNLGWRQSLGDHFRWSLEGYYRRLLNMPVPALRGMARFSTTLDPAEGKVLGADLRLEYTSPSVYGFVGYGYGWAQYSASEPQFGIWFGDPVSRYHPPHDRRHQFNAVTSVDLAGFRASARWQLGTGFPFTRPMGFGETFDYGADLHDVHLWRGDTRLAIAQPFAARLPATHRLDLSVERDSDLPFASLLVKAGAINAYNRNNMFYYDLFTARRVDQLPFAPYASVTLRGR